MRNTRRLSCLYCAHHYLVNFVFVFCFCYWRQLLGWRRRWLQRHWKALQTSATSSPSTFLITSKFDWSSVALVVMFRPNSPSFWCGTGRKSCLSTQKTRVTTQFILVIAPNDKTAPYPPPPTAPHALMMPAIPSVWLYPNPTKLHPSTPNFIRSQNYSFLTKRILWTKFKNYRCPLIPILRTKRVSKWSQWSPTGNCKSLVPTFGQEFRTTRQKILLAQFVRRNAQKQATWTKENSITVQIDYSRDFLFFLFCFFVNDIFFVCDLCWHLPWKAAQL